MQMTCRQDCETCFTPFWPLCEDAFYTVLWSYSNTPPKKKSWQNKKKRAYLQTKRITGTSSDDVSSFSSLSSLSDAPVRLWRRLLSVNSSGSSLKALVSIASRFSSLLIGEDFAPKFKSRTFWTKRFKTKSASEDLRGKDGDKLPIFPAIVFRQLFHAHSWAGHYQSPPPEPPP